MPRTYLFVVLLLQVAHSISNWPQFRRSPWESHSFTAEEPIGKTYYRLSRPLIGDDGRIYTCSGQNLMAFESNGSIGWTITLNYTCNTEMVPVQDDRGRIYLIAENRVLRIKPSDTGNFAAENFFSLESTTEGSSEIIGLAISMISSSIFITVKNRGLFAFKLHGKLLWSAGPILYRSGYRQGCKKNITDCYFTSAPVIDQCEASLYITNTEGQLYSLSLRSPHFKWIQDFSDFDKLLTITPGNNGRVYVTIPVRAVVLALDVSTGNILWQKSIGPLSNVECSPVVDANGWISIGSVDGFLYSFSPTGDLKKFPRLTALDSVVQVSPLLDCSGFAIYISQTRMEGKISRTTGEYTYVSAMKPINVVFTLLVPATGAIYWTEKNLDKLSSLVLESDLHHFALDERLLLAFITSAKMGNPLPCRTKRQILSLSCSQARPKQHKIYTGNEREILLFLLFQTAVLIVLAGFVRFCWIFWSKKKLQDQNLGKFLEKRRSLRVRKKAFDRTITELEQKTAEEAVGNEVFEKLGDLVREREGIERKLATSYSLGTDSAGTQPRSLLPLYEGRSKSYSFQGTKKESVTIFHNLSDTSATETSSHSSSSSNSESSGREASWHYHGDQGSASNAKAPLEIESWESPSGRASDSQGFTNPLFVEHTLGELKEADNHDEAGVIEPIHRESSSRVWLKRRTLSSTN
ncbi:protein GAMETE EXPRESSED 3 [Telopea speciosissima]|uniref:protein GAMETE EXPRESSED 3 n=1 Tax=Telopea speciosissima TaxID=54955 RepID=UPI001CC5638B|nr:protein GAMETE EXPRESSED 3 [Telopea speciosissima]